MQPGVMAREWPGVLIAADTLARMFNVGQRAAVASAFRLAGYDGPIHTLPVDDEIERGFVLESEAFRALRDVRDLEQVLAQLLGRKVWAMEQTGQWEAVPFE